MNEYSTKIMLLKTLQKNRLFNTLYNLRGNPRYCLYTEPLWNIPYNLYVPLATVFMYRLGVSDLQIGGLLSIGMVLQVIASLFGGIITDKLGRRLTTIIFDVLSWSIPCLIWACAQNYYWFLIATIFNSMWQITNNSWTCLLVEDCDSKKLVDVYTGVQISGLIAVFFAPVSSYLVQNFSVVTAVRVLYVFSFVLMTAKFVILFVWGHETEQGLKRKHETSQSNMMQLFVGYWAVLKKLLASPYMRLALTVMILFNLLNIATGNFLGLYLTLTLGIPESYVPLFPLVRATIMLVFIAFFQSRVNQLPFKPVMLAGLGVLMGSILVLILSPKEAYAFIIAYTFLEAVGMALVAPRKDSLVAMFIDKEERSRVSGLFYVIMIGFAAPFGQIEGLFSAIDRRLPFVFNLCVLIFFFVRIAASRTLAGYDKSGSESAERF